MARYLNQVREIEYPNTVVHEFTCTCSPESRAHERMVMGALRNMKGDYYLRDGQPYEETIEA